MTVPVDVTEEQLQNLSTVMGRPVDQLSLCFEVHGQPNRWFNLVSDECTTVNALYSALSSRLNVIDEIAVRTVDSSGQCVNISVGVGDNCSAVVDGVASPSFSRGGVRVRSYPNGGSVGAAGRRVRISVPNCNDLTLVMWVLCEEREFELVEGAGEEEETRTVERTAIKFIVMRGLNYGNRRAHGILGESLLWCLFVCLFVCLFT